MRSAINDTGARIILFKVSGTIELSSKLEIKNGNVTIAGQTAPGDGICIKNYTTWVKADNVIIRFIRFRMGDETQQEDDAITGKDRKNIIIDHCSMSWCTDECASFYDNENFTMQWCLLSESLRISVHAKGTHGYGGIWGGKTATFHHNLLAHHDSRNARFCGSRYSNLAEKELVDFRNNVIYNWGSNSSYAGEGGSYNMVNNYYKAGPATINNSSKSRIMEPYADDGKNSQAAGVWGLFFIDGNVMENSSSVSADNWLGVKPKTEYNLDLLKSSTEFEVPFVTTHSADEAYDKVLESVGASLSRDVVDSRIVREVKDGNYTYEGSQGSTGGLIDSQSDVGGWPVLNQTEALVDTDGDGIPDEWEIANGLDPENPNDGKKKTLQKGYTNVEVYMNSLVDNIMSIGSEQ